MLYLSIYLGQRSWGGRQKEKRFKKVVVLIQKIGILYKLKRGVSNFVIILKQVKKSIVFDKETRKVDSLNWFIKYFFYET